MSTISEFRRHMGMVQELMDYDPDEASMPRLTTWELGFVESLSERQCDLSEKQADVLDRIWKKCFA